VAVLATAATGAALLLTGAAGAMTAGQLFGGWPVLGGSCFGSSGGSPGCQGLAGARAGCSLSKLT
jgi:hypothetical protein